MSIIEKRINKLLINKAFNELSPLPFWMNPGAAFVTLTTEDAAIGAWTEIEGAALQDMLIVGCVAVPDTIDEVGTVQIGIGAAPSAPKIAFPVEVGITLDAIYIQFPFPIFVLAGEVVSGRFFSDTNAATCLVKLDCIGAAGAARPEGSSGSMVSRDTLSKLVDSERNTVYEMLPLQAATTFLFTPIAATPTNWAAGTWVELEDVTLTYDYWITHVILCESATVTTYFEIDIGIGAEGDEVRYGGVSGKLVDANNMIIIPLAVPIPVRLGSRVAARARGSAATAIDVGVIVARGL